ncbi:hypothetical protein SGLAM104S_04732 [Streptomyces glaucescens]
MTASGCSASSRADHSSSLRSYPADSSWLDIPPSSTTVPAASASSSRPGEEGDGVGEGGGAGVSLVMSRR